LKGRTCVVALGITSEGVKIPLGLWEGSTENAALYRCVLAKDISDRLAQRHLADPLLS
jgi:putative transposase